MGYLWLAFVAVTEASCVRNSPNDFTNNAFLIPIFTCFILSFSLYKSSLFVIIQYVHCSTLVNLTGLSNCVQMNAKDLPGIAILIRMKFQNTVAKQITTLAGIRIKLLTETAG